MNNNTTTRIMNRLMPLRARKIALADYDALTVTIAEQAIAREARLEADWKELMA